MQNKLSQDIALAIRRRCCLAASGRHIWWWSDRDVLKGSHAQLGPGMERALRADQLRIASPHLSTTHWNP